MLVSSRRDGGIIISPAQKYVSYGLDCGLVYIYFFIFYFASEERNRVGSGLICNLLIPQKRDAKIINYGLELM